MQDRAVHLNSVVANENDSHYSNPMIICICHRVSDRDIARAAREGCESFDELQFELLVATCCGRCHDCARETFHLHVSAPGAQQAAGSTADCPVRGGGHCAEISCVEVSTVELTAVADPA